MAEGPKLGPGEAPSSTQIEFRPEPPQDLLAACIWSRWSGPGEPDLLSFALVTHDPPSEVAAVGHDRCIVPIRPEDLDIDVYRSSGPGGQHVKTVGPKSRA